MKRKRVERVLAWVAGFLLTVGTFQTPEVTALEAPNCEDVSIPVALSENDPTPYQVSGLLCHKAKELPETIQILTAGATESGLHYWDFPGPKYYRSDPATWNRYRNKYSYTKYLTDAGYASLTLDRIGTGGSSTPPAVAVTVESNAYVLHQVVQALRKGSVATLAGKPKFTEVIAVGRSLGGPIVALESATYGDLDAIIIQSFRHHQEHPFAEFATALEPAQLHPRVSSRPVGYLTTRSGVRKGFFFIPQADPGVVAHEEATKDTVTSGEGGTFFPSFAPVIGVSNSVRTPVLSVVGNMDKLFCTPGCPRASEEAGHWPNAKSFESVEISDSAHSMNLEPPGRTVVFPTLLKWVNGISVAHPKSR